MVPGGRAQRGTHREGLTNDARSRRISGINNKIGVYVCGIIMPLMVTKQEGDPMDKNRVLLVDDEVEFVRALAKRLKAKGLTVEASGDGESAVEKVKQSDFDVIVLDLAMPGMDGLETLKRLREVNPDLQVILLTGHGTIKLGVEAMKEGATDFLEKPAEFSELLAKIREASARRLVLVEKRREEQVADILRGRGW
jgi:DNA-binding NtrC family response regulator